jgi:hypothetical protein
MLAVCSTPSRHIAVRLPLGLDAEAMHFDQRSGFSRPPFEPSARNQIKRREPFGHARGMVVVRRREADSVAETDIPGALRHRREKHLGGGRVRILLQEVVLDLPHIVEAETVGEFDLFERVVEQFLLASFFPRLRQLVFVEDSKPHEFPPPERYPPSRCSRAASRHAPLLD